MTTKTVYEDSRYRILLINDGTTFDIHLYEIAKTGVVFGPIQIESNSLPVVLLKIETLKALLVIK